MTLPLLPKTLIRQQIEEIINESTGRPITFFYIYSSYTCTNPNDSLDPITGTSTNSFCTVCSGLWYIPVYSGIEYMAHTTWKYDYKNEFETGGKVFIGDAQVKVIHTDERESFIKNDVKYLVVDGKTMDIVKTTILGNPPNRIITHLKEREESED